jgi:hypothetical protein
MWRKAWFNLLAFVLYTAASFGLAVFFSPEIPYMKWVYAGALAYGAGNVHFVLWFSFYTREKHRAQHGLIPQAADELPL